MTIIKSENEVKKINFFPQFVCNVIMDKKVQCFTSSNVPVEISVR